MNRITPKDERLSIEELSDQLYDYIKQFIIDPEEWTEMMKQIKEDSHNFVLHCKWNLRQK